ncbi:hypothetical protein B296_00003705 [Ensete ventricosum]|uniref:Uncharacterized protein n=1 Tax=Ensete ventricosum TaxID=4639 RepID=A0A426XZ25_ENSVE|nr:hypothetical protein B296_00003705 [Ensete ventricosum]
MRVDFLRWKDGDSTGRISRAERYFRFYKTPKESMVNIAIIHLEGDVTQWLANEAQSKDSTQLTRTQLNWGPNRPALFKSVLSSRLRLHDSRSDLQLLMRLSCGPYRRRTMLL